MLGLCATRLNRLAMPPIPSLHLERGMATDDQLQSPSSASFVPSGVVIQNDGPLQINDRHRCITAGRNARENSRERVWQYLIVLAYSSSLELRSPRYSAHRHTASLRLRPHLKGGLPAAYTCSTNRQYSQTSRYSQHITRLAPPDAGTDFSAAQWATP